MDLVYSSNDFPKDDLQTLFRHLRNQSKTRQHTILAHFLATATSSADDAELRKSSLCGAVNGVLLVILHLSAYIGFVEDNPDKFLRYPEANITALGDGLLLAAVISASTTLPELASNSSSAVFLAFRMENTDSWAYVVQNDKGGPMTAKIFVSAYGETLVTISGPLSRLTALVTKSHFFRTARCMALPVYGGLCHAPHIYGADDVQKLMSGISLSAIETSTLPLYSTSSGRPYPARSFSGMIEHVLSELLTQAICWDSVVAGVSHRIGSPAVSTLSLYCLGKSLPLHELKTALVANVPSLEISTELLTTCIYRPTNNDSAPRSAGQSKLAIVGMSCRLPGGATDIEKFWKLLEDGLDVSRQIPADRFDVETPHDPTGSQLNKSMTQYGCFIDEPGMFDASFYNMSPREAQTVDPQMRLALVTAYEALEQAGCVGGRTAATQLQRVGTWYGQAADDYREVNQVQSVSTYYIPGGCRAFGPGRINYFFKFAGPSYSVDTACSSGLAAIEVAYQALWNGEVDTAIAGGLNVLTNPDGFAGLYNAYTLGQYLLKKSGVKTSKNSINITELDVTKRLVAQKDTKTSQRIRVIISTEDMISGLANMTWCNVDNSGVPQHPFATATLVYGNPSEWLSSWTPLSHLIESRIDALTDLANKGQASRFTGNMAYTLFASNLVDYAEKYRGMQSVVLRELEACADVQLTTHEGGVWTVPPYFIHSVAHLAGFITNCSDAMDTHKNFCVTPGWKSMRFAKPLVAGMTYSPYVKMTPTPEDATVYTGDVYIMQEGQIIGLVGGIKFGRYPRLLLDRFFSAPDKANSSVPQKASHATPKASEPSSASQKPSTEQKQKPVPSVKQEAPVAIPKPAVVKESASSPTIVDRALKLIAEEAGLDITELEDDADFADLGVDSLMSLVITEKFKTTLDVVVGGSLFLDYPSIGDLRGWLESSYG
ncbi:putative polyketide synthase, partial [Aureobasidium melanogenum]